MPSNTEIRTGLFASIGAYVLWGFLPLYFKFLGDTPPTVILAHRIVWSVPTALVLIAAAGKWGELTGLWRSPRVMFTLLGSSLAIATNWTIYIWAVTNGRVLSYPDVVERLLHALHVAVVDGREGWDGPQRGFAEEHGFDLDLASVGAGARKNSVERRRASNLQEIRGRARARQSRS